MTNEQTDKTDTAGKEVVKPVETPEETPEEPVEKTPSQKLKEENDALELELVRAQKIRNEALLAGTAGGRVEPEVHVETPEEKAERFRAGGLDILAK